jgi:hypothetical protein
MQRGGSPRQVEINRPVAESNCGGGSRPWRATGSELSVRNKRARESPKVNSIRWDATGEYASEMRNLELKPMLSMERQLATTAARVSEPVLKKTLMTEKPGRARHMVGDRTVGSSDEISSELPTRNRNGVHAGNSRRTDRGKSERP